MYNLRRRNVKNAEERENIEPKRRCSSIISTSEGTDSTLKALKIPEILLHIIKYLPVNDIINCRCVCQLWNEYCDMKFVFRKFDFQFLDVTALLLNSSCRRMELEFQDYPLMHIPVNTWKILSPKIRTLQLHCCDLEKRTLQSIISNCTALENLEICRKYTFCFPPLELSFVQLLDNFIERKEQRTRLRTLAIRGQKFSRVSELLRKIFTVFPRIVNLSCILEEVYKNGEASCSAYDGTYDLRKLKSFTMISENDYLWTEYPVVPVRDCQLFRLTKFKTVLYVETFLKDVTKKQRLFHFFIAQKELEIIDLKMKSFRGICEDGICIHLIDAFIVSLLRHVLKTCTNLREFRIHVDHRVIMELSNKDSEEFFSFISGMRCLKLSRFLLKEISATTARPLLLPNPKLRAVQMIADGPYCVPIIKLSPGLNYMDITVSTDERLKEIIMALPNLETLILRLAGCTNYGLIGENEESSIRRLRNLKYLQIIDYEKRITKEIFDEFHFPCLKYLGLFLHCRNELPETFSNIPALRTLQVCFTQDETSLWRMENVFELCKSLRNLEHLIVDDLVYQDVTSEKHIFNSFSKLSFITCCKRYITYIYHRPSGKEMCSFTRDLKFFGSMLKRTTCLRHS